MSTLEYGTYTGPPLRGERLHRCLVDLQDSTIRKHHMKRPALSVSDYEDLYARAMLVLIEKHPDASFPAPQAVVSWLDRTITNSAIDILRRRGLGRESSELVSVSDARSGEDEPPVVQPVDVAPTPEQQVLLDEDSLSLSEFIASLAPEDRKISFLHLHPGSRMKLRQIAHALDLPTAQVNTVLKRVDKRFSRYVALEVDAVCALRERDLAAWKRTGEMPAALRWHARRCSTCNAKIMAARTDVHRSLVPLVGVLGLPTGAGGFFVRFFSFTASRPLVVRRMDELQRLRRFGQARPGGDGAVVSAKAIVTGAAVSVAAVGAGVAVIQSTHDIRHVHRPVITAGVATTSTTVTTRTIARPPSTARSRPPATTRVTTTRTLKVRARSTTTGRTSPRAIKKTVAPIVPAPSPSSVTASSPTTTPAVAPRPAASPKPVTTTGPPATRSGSSRAPSSAAGSGSSPSGGLPDLQQTQQQP